MSETTNLQLKKHDNVSTNTNAFDIENYLNGNWDKIDTAYGNTTTNINAKYTKPVGGIPKTDLDSSVQTSLGKADTAIQTHQDISGKEDKSNKVTSISSESTNTQYPSAKLLYDKLAEKQTEIDNLQTDVEDLRNASYKVPGTGTDITLENTSENKFVEFGLEGRTEQEQLEGYNLFEVTKVYEQTTLNGVTFKTNSDGTITLNGTATNNMDVRYNEGTFEIQLEANQNYILSKKIINGTASQIMIAYRVNDVTSTFTGTTQNLGSSGEARKIRAGRVFVNTGDVFNNVTVGLMLLKGSTDKNWEQYCGRNTSTKSYL